MFLTLYMICCFSYLLRLCTIFQNRKTFEDEESSLDVGILELDNAVQSICDTLNVLPGDALLLLVSNKWDKAAAVDFFVSDEIGAKKIAGIIGNNAVSSVASECGVCLDALGDDATLLCGHGFCKDCWESQLEVKVKERPSGAVSCMWPKCFKPVSEEVCF